MFLPASSLTPILSTPYPSSDSHNGRDQTEVTEEQIRASYDAEIKAKHAKWLAKPRSVPEYDAGDKASGKADALENVRRKADSTFTPIHTLQDSVNRVHPWAFAFILLFDIPVWRRTDNVDEKRHSLMDYYTDSAVFSLVLRQQARKGKAVHLLTSGKCDGGWDQDAVYFPRVPPNRLFVDVDSTTRAELMQLWGLARDGSGPTLISLGHILDLASDLELNLSRGVEQHAEETFWSLVAAARSTKDQKSQKRSANSFLECVVRSSCDPLPESLLCIDKYMSFEQWLEKVGSRVRVGNTYCASSKGLLLRWKSMCRRPCPADLDLYLPEDLKNNDYMFHCRSDSVSELWTVYEEYANQRDADISLWQRGALWTQQTNLSKRAARLTQGEGLLRQWYYDTVVKQASGYIDAVHKKVDISLKMDARMMGLCAQMIDERRAKTTMGPVQQRRQAEDKVLAQRQENSEVSAVPLTPPVKRRRVIVPVSESSSKIE